jgi:hypothetical protein
MSWHWSGPVSSRWPAPPNMRAIMAGSACRSAALSAAVAAPLPPRAFTTLSSIGCVWELRRTRGEPPMSTTKSPRARAAATACRCASMSAGAAPWRGGACRPLKMRGELTMAADAGFASGTLMTSMRNSAEFGSLAGAAAEHPGSSASERTFAEPEM